MVLLHLQVVTGLEIEPEPVARAEVPRKAERRVRRDAPLAVHDLVMRRGGTPIATARRFWLRFRGSRKSSIRTSPGWIGAMVLIGVTSSVVIDDLDVDGPGVGPGEADRPLLVDPDAVLAGSVAA